MKFKRAKSLYFSFSKSKFCALFLAPILLSTQAFSATDKAERWFEIEVILFSQLGNKALIKENFPDQKQQPTALPNYRYIKDLLTPHVYPDISTLILQLPQCGDFSKAKTLIDIATTPQVFVTTKSLAQINQMSNEDDVEKTEENITKTTSITTSITTKTEQPLDQLLATDEFISSITPEQQALVSQAELEFASIKFNYSDGFPINQICSLPKTFDNKFHLNLSGSIDGNEDLYSDKPYLISKESLQLSDIVIKLKRSRNFKPILHLGWREAPKDRNKATAFRIFAGENLAFNDDRAQQNYQTWLQKSTTATASSTQHENNTTDDTQAIDININNDLTNESPTPEQILQNRINDILAAVDDISALDESQILSQLDDKSLTIDTTDKQHSPVIRQQPIKPIQPWILDGLFRVHLNHYLYITADFNLLQVTPAEQEQQILTLDEPPKFQSIRFQQNRRVISGEIHYFDHPYLGMIVQIRKHQRPDPETDVGDLDNTNSIIISN